MIEFPRIINKKLNFQWLLTAYRHGDLYGTLNSIKKEEVSEMLQDLDYEMQQLTEKHHQQTIEHGKYLIIIKELNDIKKIFIQNLSDRVEKMGSFVL